MHVQMRSIDTNACSRVPGFVPLSAAFMSQVIINGEVVRNRSLLCFTCAGCSVHTGRLVAFARKASTFRRQDGTTPCGFAPAVVFDGFPWGFSLQVRQLLASRFNVSISTVLAGVMRFVHV